MLSKKERDEIIKLINREVVPAMGCTEPVAVALAVAKATETLGKQPEKINVGLSGNVLKNAMGVGIPGTGMIGLPIAIALGALIGKSEYSLEVLKDVNDEAVKAGCRYIDSGAIKIEALPDAPSKLYIVVDVEAGNDKAKTIIAGGHTNFIHISANGNIELEKEFNGDSIEADGDDPILTLKTTYEFATSTPLEEIEFIIEAAKLNQQAAEHALEGEFGHSLGATMRKYGASIFGDTPIAHMIQYTSAACDARMGGAPIAVMSNSGSGNQGITATMPVVTYAREIGASHEQLVRALIMSHLTSIYIKQSLGRLSALCGCVVASTGASCGIVLLMGGDYSRVSAAVKNMIANLTGMICDGAKPSCAMKISSSVSTAALSAMLAMQDKCVTSAEGIVHDDVDITIRNLTDIGRDAMNETDRLVLNIMTNK